jgi:hypothetical protein
VDVGEDVGEASVPVACPRRSVCLVAATATAVVPVAVVTTITVLVFRLQLRRCRSLRVWMRRTEELRLLPTSMQLLL